MLINENLLIIPQIIEQTKKPNGIPCLAQQKKALME